MPRRSTRMDAAYLNDMCEACATIASRTSHRSLADLVSCGEFRDGVVLQLIHLGEAASQLTDETRRAYSDVSWREVVGLRNLLVHKYWAVDHLKIWEYARTDVPALLAILTGER